MIRYIDHTADAGFEVEASGLVELFEEAAYAMLDMLYRRELVNEAAERRIEVSSTAVDLLLHDFLSELLQVTEYDGFLVKTLAIDDISDRRVSCTLRGEDYDPQRHEFLTEIKAVTYHQLAAEPRGDKWYGRVIFDI